MSNTIDDLKAYIRLYIKENHQGEITGPVLQNVLLEMVDGLTGTTDSVKYVEQTLTEAQRAQARTNIGAAASTADTYTKAEVDSLLEDKEDVIEDLDEIRTGAELGSTALQSVPDTYATKAYVTGATASKQDALTTEQLDAVNSGIDSEKVASIANKENTSNKVNTISSSSTTAQYPTAALLYNLTNAYKTRVVSSLPSEPDANTIYFVID